METRAQYGKADRLSIRISESDKDTLERAAELAGLTTSGFIVREALASADALIAEKTRFELDDEAWAALCERLDEAPRELPAIRRVADAPSPFDE